MGKVLPFERQLLTAKALKEKKAVNTLRQFQERLEGYVKSIKKKRLPPAKPDGYALAVRSLRNAKWRPVCDGVWGARLPDDVKALWVGDRIVLSFPQRDPALREQMKIDRYLRALIEGLPDPELPHSVRGGLRAQMHAVAFDYAARRGVFKS